VTGEHCYRHYSDPPRHVYVAVVSDTAVAVAFGDGPCPSSLPADHQVFHR
jgi:hypothetical protein